MTDIWKGGADGQADSRTGGPAHPAALCGHEPGTDAVLGVLWGAYPKCQYTDGICHGGLSLRGLVRGAGAHLGQGRAVACSQSYIEQLSRAYSAATVKQNLAALRQLFDWLVVGQVMTQAFTQQGEVLAELLRRTA